MDPSLARARRDASRALACALAGLVCFGIFLGPTAFVLARSASAAYRRRGQPAPARATVALALGSLVSLLWAVLLALRLSGLVR